MTAQIVSGHPHFIWIQLPDESVLWCPIDGQSRAAVKVIQFGRYCVTLSSHVVKDIMFVLTIPHLCVRSFSHILVVREVIAKAIGKPERADWKLCEVDKEQESGMTETLKSAFRLFDPFSE